MKRIRSHVPIILAILSIGIAGYKTFEDILARPWADPATQIIPTWEKRIQPIRDFLPPEVTIVGYLEKSMVTGQANISTGFDGEEFFLMQYSMAPVILDLEIDHPWIVGNFDNDTDFRSWLDENLGDYEIQNFGSSLYLIHKLEE
jgi:hypothetical protein